MTELGPVEEDVYNEYVAQKMNWLPLRKEEKGGEIDNNFQGEEVQENIGILDNGDESLESRLSVKIGKIEI